MAYQTTNLFLEKVNQCISTTFKINYKVKLNQIAFSIGNKYINFIKGQTNDLII